MAITLFGWASSPADNGSQAPGTWAVVPPSSMVAGQLVVVATRARQGGSGHAVVNAGGQTWTAEQLSTDSVWSGVHWCVFDGTWDANPTFTVTTGVGVTILMLVFDKTGSTWDWGIESNGGLGTSNASPSSPFTCTITGRTTTNASTVSIAFWGSQDDNTWGSLSGSGWSKTNLPAQIRNTAGQDSSISAAINILTSAGTVADVSQNQATLGGDAWGGRLLTFYEVESTPAITLPFINDGDTLHAPTVVPGAVTVALPFINTGNTLYSPTVVPPPQSVTLPFIDDADTIYSPTVVPGAATVTLPFLSDGDTLYSPTIVPGAVSVSLPFLSDGDTLYPPSLVQQQFLTLPFINDGDTLYVPTVVPGAVSVTLPFINDADTLYPPTAVPGAVSVTLPFIDSGSALYAPSVSSGGVEQTVILPSIGVGPSPVVQVQKKLHASTADATSHTVTYDSVPAEGNTLILACTAGALITTPSGWTLVDNEVAWVEGAIFRKTAGASEPSSVTITIASSMPFSAVFMEYSGLTGAVDQFSSQGFQGGDGTVNTPSISTTVSECLIVALAATREEGAPITSWSNSFTEEGKPQSTNSTDADVVAGVATRRVSSTGSYSTTATLTSNGVGEYAAVIAAFPVAQQSHSNVLYAPTVVQSGQSITLPFIDDPDTLYAPTVVPGAVSITLPFISDGDTLFAPTVVPGAVALTLPFISDGDTLYAPAVVPGAVSVTLPFINDGDTLYAPTVVPGPVTVTLPLITDPDTLYPPTVIPGAVTVTLPFIDDADTLYPPTVVAQGVSLTLPFIASAAVLYPPTVVPGAAQVTLPFIASGSQLYAPSVVPGAVVIAIPFIGSTSVLYPVSLSSGLQVKVWNGVSYDNAEVYVRAPGGIVPGTVKIWDGVSWI